MKLGRWLVTLALICLAVAGLPATATQGVPEYRILNRYRSKLADSWDVAYTVRVERYLTKRDMKTLVCAVLEKEKPQDYRRLSIWFNYRLDSYDLVPTEEYTRSKLGRYAWSKNLGGNPYSLFQRRDEHGEPLPRSAQFSSFDHTKECPVEEGSASEDNPRRPE